MQNKNYEAVKAKYVDEMMLRIMELEASNEMLKEKISANSAAAPKTSGAPVSSSGMPVYGMRLTGSKITFSLSVLKVSRIFLILSGLDIE